MGWARSVLVAPPPRWLSWALLLFALADASRPARAQEYHDNVVVVLDASGSMKETLAGTRLSKMGAAKNALKTVLQKVPPSTHIGLLVFSTANLKDEWVYPLGPRDDTRLMQAIEGIEAAGGTPLGQFIKKGADRLLQERAKQFGYGTYRMLVVTDGEAQDQELVDRFTPDVMSRGITMDVIGVGMKQDHTLARKSHSYRRANDAAAFNRALTEVFAEIGSSGTDVAQAEAFETIAPIPGEVAAIMIQALSGSGNHPIGTRPTPAPVGNPQSNSAVDSPPANAAPPVTTPAPPSQPAPTAVRRRFPFWPFVIGAIILFSLLNRTRKGVRR
jgi:uncharacterized protein YegL